MAKRITRATPDSSATIEVPSTFTPDQNAQIFQLVLLKAQADLQKAQADLQKAQAERDAILAKSGHKFECLLKESEARVAAATWNGSMSREKGTTPWWMTKLKIENFSQSIKCTISFSPFSSHHHPQSSAFLSSSFSTGRPHRLLEQLKFLLPLHLRRCCSAFRTPHCSQTS